MSLLWTTFSNVDVIRLKREAESVFDILDILTIQVLKHPVVSGLANCIDSLKSKTASTEYQHPNVPLNLTGKKTPIFIVDPSPSTCRTRALSTHSELEASNLDNPSYAIVGYSYGGVVAYEVAKRLESMGNDVGFTSLVHISGRMHEIDAMLNLSSFLGLVSKQDAHDLAPSLRLLTRGEQLDAVWAVSPAERLVAQKLAHWVDVAGSLIGRGKEYERSGSVCKPDSCLPRFVSFDVFYAAPLRGSKEDWLNRRLESWSQFSREKPIFTDVLGK